MRFGEVTLLEVGGHGPEDVVLDGEGRIYTGVDDGRILRHTADGRGAETIADTGGRPLGLELYGDDELLICDARAGLLVMPLAERHAENPGDVGAGPGLRVLQQRRGGRGRHDLLHGLLAPLRHRQLA